MPKRDRRLKEEIKKCKETNRSLNDFFSSTNKLEDGLKIENAK
jgi:hypothetical protein